jgi:hypothetical protein
MLKLQQPPNLDLTVQSLMEIFEIMCIHDDFESPIVLCAAYISLLEAGIYHSSFTLLMASSEGGSRSKN